jgi:NH3-dependent NAD+ synthetase
MANIYAAIEEAVANGSDILALEEMAYNGYESNDDFQKTDNARTYAHLKDIAAYAAALDPELIISVGHSWRLNRRDVKARTGLESERVKNPLFNRLDLPFNVQTLITRGEVRAMTAKMHLFNDERGYEKRYFSEWSMQAANEYGGTFGTIDAAMPDGRVIPFGRPVVQFADAKRNLRVNAAHIICEEKWVATRFGGAPHDDKHYARDGVAPSIARYVGSRDGLIGIIPNASPPTPLKMDKHIHLAKMASKHADIIIDTDGVGSSGSTFTQFGHRLIVQNEKLLSTGARLSFNRVAANSTTARVKNAPAATAAKAHAIIPHDFKNAAHKPWAAVAFNGDVRQAWDNPAAPDRDKEELVRMTALWLFDYMRKSKCNGIAQALSGGADSAFNSVLLAAMVRIGVRELGVKGFCDELPHIKYRDAILAAEQTGGEEMAIKECLRHMLTTVYMGTSNSSDETREAARFLVEGGTGANGTPVDGIGGIHHERNVQDLLNFYALAYSIKDTTAMYPQRRVLIERDLGALLNAKPGSLTDAQMKTKIDRLRDIYPEINDVISAANPRDALAYENIQARGRQVLIMLFANAEGKMAVANPNLDEARNAYATFGGDLHSGTINLNAHIPKKYQLQIMRYLYEHGLDGVMEPVRALEKVIKNKPSAELQPKSADGKVVQNDEDALQRSFGQMNRISRLMLHEKIREAGGERLMNAGEVFDHCRHDPEFSGVGPNNLFNMIRLSYARWGVAQHKIHASPVAPTFGSNVDHQTSRRTPTLNGQSLDELTTLGVRLLYSFADEDGITLPGDRTLIETRAAQDEHFIAGFDAKLWSGGAGLAYNLRGLYDSIKADGWDSVAAPLPAGHPLQVIRRYRARQADGLQPKPNIPPIL